MKRNLLILFLVGSCFGVIRGQDFVNYTTDNGLPHNNVNCITVDDEDNVWMGTQMGVAKFDGKDKWTYYTEDDGVLKNNVKSIGVNPHNGEVWIGTDYGVGVFDGKEWKNYNKDDGLINNRINYIGFDKDGSVWFTSTAGISHFDGKDWVNYNEDNGLPTNLMGFVHIDKDGVKWFASVSNGIVKYDGKDFVHYKMDDHKFLSDKVKSIITDEDGNFWIGSLGGLSHMNEKFELIENYEYKTSDLYTEYVFDLDFDSKGNVWIATYTDYLGEGAINMFNGKDWSTYGLDQNLVSFVIRRIVVDSKDDVWVATGNGLSRLSPVLGIKDKLSLKNNLFLFPNPALDFVNIGVKGDVKQVEIYNQAMQKMDEILVNPGTANLRINLNNYPAGLYFVRSGLEMKKLIVAHN